MKKLFLFLILCNLLFFNSPSYGFDLNYTVHTTAKDIEFKKGKALQWYDDSVNKGKSYFLDANKDIQSLKNKSLKWYEANITKGKFYFIDSNKELQSTKNEALRWYQQNSQ